MNLNSNIIFPKIQQSVSDFLFEEEANINRGKLLMIGSLMVIVGVLINPEGSFAAHRSHSSHSSHRSHSSHASHSSSSYGGGGGGSGGTGGGSNVVPSTNPSTLPSPSPIITPTPPPAPVTQVPQTPPLTPLPLD